MELILQRLPSYRQTTLGYLFHNGDLECRTLEDQDREVPGRPVKEWKVKGETAIPAGRYRLALVDSPKFGPDTITLLDVPGFEYVRIHSGEDKDDTDGCIIVGDQVSEDGSHIHGGKARGVLAKLKEKVVPVLKQGGQAFITIRRASKAPPADGADAVLE